MGISRFSNDRSASIDRCTSLSRPGTTDTANNHRQRANSQMINAAPGNSRAQEFPRSFWSKDPPPHRPPTSLGERGTYRDDGTVARGHFTKRSIEGGRPRFDEIRARRGSWLVSSGTLFRTMFTASSSKTRRVYTLRGYLCSVERGGIAKNFDPVSVSRVNKPRLVLLLPGTWLIFCVLEDAIRTRQVACLVFLKKGKC